MPNNITTFIFINGTPEQVTEVKNFIKNDEKETLFDFNTVIPMPEELNITSGSMGEHGMAYLLGDENALQMHGATDREEAIRLGAKYLVNLALYGATTWYDWCRVHWGTKWNAYSTEDLGNGIKIETAWSYPEPVILALSKHFPDIEFHCVYADEDVSYNTGEVTLKDGGYLTQFYPEGGSNEGWELYLLTHEYEADSIEKDENGNYRFKEE